MSTRKIKDAKDLENNELIYFKGHAKATYMSDGTNVEEALTKKQDEIKDLDTIRQNASRTIPSKTSELTNDSGFLTEHQDISHLATQSQLSSIGTELSELGQNVEQITSVVNESLLFDYDKLQIDAWNTISGAYLGTSGNIVVGEGSTSYDIYVYQVKKGEKYIISGTYRAVWSACACFDTEFKSADTSIIRDVIAYNQTDHPTINIEYSITDDGYLYVVSDFEAYRLELKPSLKKDLEYLKNGISYSGIKNTIACWGDSLTAGAGATSEDNMWVSILRRELTGKYDVVNCGHGGQRSNEIASRQGGLQPILRLNNPIITPSFGNYVVIAKLDYDNNKWLENEIVSDKKAERQLLQGGYYEADTKKGVGFVEILGQKYFYQLYGEGHTIWRGNGIGEYTLTASIDSQYTERELRGDVPLAYQSAKDLYDCYAQVIFIGENGGYDSVENLYQQIKRMIERCISNRYIVLSSHKKKEVSEEMEDMFLENFGTNFLNLRSYFSTYGIGDAIRLGLMSEPSNADSDAMANGDCPPSFLSDSVHFNDIGQKLLSKIVYEKGSQLGYW